MNESTNQNHQRLKRMLEEATAAETSASPISESRDAETVSLREAWLAFEQLVRAADASLPAMPNITVPIASPQSRSGRWSRRRWIGLLAAAAAMLLAAVTIGWWFSRGGDRGATPTAPTAVAKQEQLQTAIAQADRTTNKQPPAGLARTSTVTTSPTKTSTWDDSLDTQIASVSQQISNVEQNWRHRVDDVDLVQYRIDEVTDSLKNDSL